MLDLDGQPILPFDYVAIVQRDGSRPKVTIGQVEVVDHVENVVGVRRISQNGKPCSSYWVSIGLKRARPSECIKIYNQRP